MQIKIVHNDNELLAPSMRKEISSVERGKNIQIMEKAQEAIIRESKSTSASFWLNRKFFGELHDGVVGFFKDLDYIANNSLYAPPTNREFVKVIAEEIGDFVKVEVSLVWDRIPEATSKNFPKNANNFIESLLKNPKVCNIPASQIGVDEKNRVGVVSDGGDVVNPVQTIREGIRKYYEENLNGVKIPINDLIEIKNTIEVFWETQFSLQGKPSRLSKQ